ncbi:MAG: hypothetical protein EPN17_15945 [Methylobacter sp.]|nr:MAG: hypothetical protein EPN17_15945 [Methylobacter sp.]
MQELCIIEFEFAKDYFEPIKKIVREGNPLITTAYIEDIYFLENYMLSGKNAKFNVLLDNNIFTRLVYLAKGGQIQGDDESIKTYKFCCAVMCFFILGGFDIEPNLALYERASKNTHSNAIKDIDHFRVADHIHPMGYAELALGVRDKFSDKEINKARNIIDKNLQKTEEQNYSKQLNDWKIKYLHLLKIIEIQKCKLEDTEQIKIFFEWITKDCFTTPATIMFALLFFSPNRHSLGKMIKNVNSQNNKLKDGLKNAAWDLTYLTSLRNKSKNQSEDTIWFLCTHDKLLQTIARSLYLKEGQEIETAVYNLINEFWGTKKGSQVYDYYKKMVVTVSENNIARTERNREISKQVGKMIEDLESRIFSAS